jgi:hypothetical protein
MRHIGRASIVIATFLTARSSAGFARQSACEGERSGVVEGRVVDFPTLVPLSGADVDVRWITASSAQEERKTRSDSAGAFRICGLPLGTRLFVRAKYLGAESQPRQVTLDGGTPARFVLRVSAPSATVEGRVIDHGTGQPVASASVRLAGFRDGRLTRDDGSFRFDRVPAGQYAMTVEHLAFLPMHETLRVDDGNRIQATIRLAPTVIAVAALEVVARSVRLETAGFYTRQGRRIGTFITRNEIDVLRSQRPSDVLRRLAGIQFRDSRLGMQAMSRGNCPFRFVVDGARIGSGASIDDVTNSAIEGIEIYMGPSQVPAEFTSISVEASANCGVIVVWTRNRR